MKISDILSTNSIFTEVKANNKRQLLQELAIKMANMSQLDERLLSDAIMERDIPPYADRSSSDKAVVARYNRFWKAW